MAFPEGSAPNRGIGPRVPRYILDETGKHDGPIAEYGEVRACFPLRPFGQGTREVALHIVNHHRLNLSSNVVLGFPFSSSRESGGGQLYPSPRVG